MTKLLFFYKVPNKCHSMAKGLSKMAISLNLLAHPKWATDQNFRMVLSFDLRLGRPLKTREMQRN